jgi:NAD(P)-dependent dehydrogenase (short-subunit alcohol dehydrogenase family)
MAYKMVIFDLDGTLADTFPWFLSVLNGVADRYRFRRIEKHEVERLRGFNARQMVKHLGVPAWKLPLIARHMRLRARGSGRILITGSIAGFTPGTYQAVYNATKAFIDSFSFALRHEVKDQGITVTCLMPGATETEFFERADMMDTKVGQGKKDDPADVAKTGFAAMMRGDGDVVSGWMNKLQSAIASVTPAGILAEQHRKKAQPGSGQS